MGEILRGVSYLVKKLFVGNISKFFLLYNLKENLFPGAFTWNLDLNDPLVYDAFASNEPNNSGGAEHCGEMPGSSSPTSLRL